MDKRAILQSIIDADGACPGLKFNEGDYALCAECPMSKLKKRHDGTYLSCFDSLISDAKHLFDVDRVYREKAVELLSDILIEDMLKGELSAEGT